MLSSLETVMNALLTVTENVGHYTAWNDKDKYIVWAEDSEYSSLKADNYVPVEIIEGTIDYFTKDEDDENIGKIPQALNAAGVGWSLNSVQYEDETRFIHYEWLFRVRQHFTNDPVTEGDDGEDHSQGA